MYGLKSKFNMRVEIFEKQENGSLKSKLSTWSTINRKEFLKDLEDQRSKGENFKVEICNAPPSKFQFNTFYVRADGKAAYIYVLKEE